MANQGELDLVRSAVISVQLLTEHAATKAPPHTLDVPNELWTRIFRFAAFVPGSLEINHDDPFDHLAVLPNTALAIPTDFLFPSIRLSNANKLSFALVCKRWHDLVIPLLYETVHITRSQSLVQLRTTLVRSKEEASSGSADVPLLGSWTRRVNLAMTDLPTTEGTYDRKTKSFSVPPTTLEELVTIFSCLTKLEILVLSCPDDHIPHPKSGSSLFPQRISEAAWKSLEATCGNTLLRFEYNQRSYLFAAGGRYDKEGIFKNFTQIRTIHPQAAIWGFHNCSLCAQDLPFLTSCASPTNSPKDCACVKEPSDPPYPLLSTLIFQRVVPNVKSIVNFLAVQGSLITTVLVQSFTLEYYRWLLEQLQRHCPNLTRLILFIPRDKFTDISYLDSEDEARDFLCLVPNSVTHLGILLNTQHLFAPRYRRSDDLQPETILRWLAFPDMEPPSTSIRLVRFFSWDHFAPRSFGDKEPEIVGSDTELGVGVRKLQDRGIKVEGFEGQELQCGA